MTRLRQLQQGDPTSPTSSRRCEQLATKIELWLTRLAMELPLMANRASANDAAGARTNP
jgi:hypothetical protein